MVPRGRFSLAYVNGVRERGEPVGANGLNLRGALDAIGRRSVRRHIERLVGVFGPVEVVRTENLVLGSQVVVRASKNCRVSLLVNNR